jgi:hypothetical protein
MSDKRTTGPLAARVEPRGESLAQLSDHLGRLLAHADTLLLEWQTHADGAARNAGDVLHRTLEAALADAAQMTSVQLERALGANATRLLADLERARQAAADLEGHMARIAGGARPTSVDELRAALSGLQAQLRARRGPPWALLLAVTANVLGAAVLALLLVRAPATVPAPAPDPVAPPAAAPAAIVLPDAPPAPAPKPTCSGLPSAPAAKLAQACLAQLCGAQAPRACRPADPAAHDLVAALATLEHDRALAKLACAPPAADADGKVTVSVRWLLECPAAH